MEVKGKQGFASMPKRKVKKIAKLGGKADYVGKKGFAANPDRAREAGRLGGIRRAQRQKDTQTEG